MTINWLLLVIDAFIRLLHYETMIRVRLLKSYKGNTAGEVISVSDKVAQSLFKKGIAMRDKMLTRQDFSL